MKAEHEDVLISCTWSRCCFDEGFPSICSHVLFLYKNKIFLKKFILAQHCCWRNLHTEKLTHNECFSCHVDGNFHHHRSDFRLGIMNFVNFSSALRPYLEVEKSIELNLELELWLLFIRKQHPTSHPHLTQTVFENFLHKLLLLLQPIIVVSALVFVCLPLVLPFFALQGF